jgi:hypothetical protein
MGAKELRFQRETFSRSAVEEEAVSACPPQKKRKEKISFFGNRLSF